MASATRKIAIRVDASQEIGAGHFMRCLALADALSKDGCTLHFVCRHLPDHLRQSVTARGYGVTLLHTEANSPLQHDLHHSRWLGVPQGQDAAETLEALKDERWDWLVVDHYALDFRWERELRRLTRNILVIDDLADRQHDCDALVDQNLYEGMESRYQGKVPDHCECLLGPRYALLRDEFRTQRNDVRIRTGPLKRVLLFFGGIDGKNFTRKAIRALEKASVPDLIVDVVIGASHPARSEIEAECKRLGYRCHVQTSRMAELMRSADLSIGAGGTACWERAALGLPAIALCAADNQAHQLRDAARSGLLYFSDDASGDENSLARHFSAVAENSILRENMSAHAFATVDGMGIYGLLNVMTCGGVEVRPAKATDSALLFEWRNHAQIRMQSQTPQEFDWKTHQAWMAGVLADPQRALLVGFRRDRPIGMVRFDLQGEIAEVSIHVAPETGSVGLGPGLLRAAEMWFWERYPQARKIRAFVLGKNLRSQNFFKGAGYELDSETYLKTRKRNN